ncbi:RagB/SusD family nutrient uptake outer membrane protein [Capnocytophaga canimorsus]|nr:RagB/SusD family nutrient uptake outer membrane protein [Capnocytophaga canimorsus]WGU67679.1 RagB/SusD family nutrient uptake outer membrane protein [Capnocytophaga canimorsus]WGU71200.1 RagB/SusD family nutrient uptake outer membrane protein [Capnocytophaga canimorsus]
MKKLYFLTILTGIVISCDKYLDIEPKGSVIPTTVEDYDLLMNSVHSTSNESVLALTADDFDMRFKDGDIKQPDNQEFQMYSWGDLRFYNPTYPVNAWNSAYVNIYTNNKVINEVMQSNLSMGYTEADKLSIQAASILQQSSRLFFPDKYLC